MRETVKFNYVILGTGLLLAACRVPCDAHPLHPRLALETSQGDIILELDAEKAPLTVLNYVRYARDNFYDGTTFHRVLEGGLIQGGAFTPDMLPRQAALRPGIKSESNNGLTNERGTIAMVRAPNRPNSATSQFFINVRDNPDLSVPKRDRQAYTVFGKVVDGMDVVDRISRTPVGPHPNYAAGRLPVAPLTPVVIKNVRLLTKFDPEAARQVAVRSEMQARQVVEEAAEAKLRTLSERLAEIERQYGEFTTTPSGLKYVDIRMGLGPSPEVDDIAEILYQITLADGTEIESTLNAEPKASPLEDAIKGVREGLLSMKEGGKRMLVIPPELGFGDTGYPGKIPPNATLFFEIELLAVQIR